MPRSQAEVKMAHVVLEGKAKQSGMSAEYAKEVISKMHGKKMASLPEHTKPKREYWKRARKNRKGK